MNRFDIYQRNFALFSNMNYLFNVDSDVTFSRDAKASDFIGDLVGIPHPVYPNGMPQAQRKDGYERNSGSTSYIPHRKGSRYFFGAFWGGSVSEISKMLLIFQKRIAQDLEKGIIDAWQDENHLNRYFVDHPPTRVLPARFITATGTERKPTRVSQSPKDTANMR